MGKKIFISLGLFFCANNVFGDQVKKLTDKEFVIKKQRNDSFQEVEKPKYLANDSDEQKFSPQKFSLQDIELELKTLPINLDLRDKEKKIRKVKHNLVRLGMGMGLQPEEKYFVHLGDVLLKKKIDNLATHLIFKSRNPIYPGWLQDLQLFADYKVTNFCKPFFVFNENWKSFKVGNKDLGTKKSSVLNFDFNFGCPLIFEKSEFFPSLNFRTSKFNSLEEVTGDKKEEKGTENEVNLNFNFSSDIVDNFKIVDNIKISCEASLQNLNYDKNFPIFDWQDAGWKELGDASNVTFLNVKPKIHFVIGKIELTPEFLIGYCPNKKFIKDPNTNFIGLGGLGGKILYTVNDQTNVYLDYDSLIKVNTFKKLFEKNPWVSQQAVMASTQYGGAVGGSIKISNFKINPEFRMDVFDNLPTFVSVKEEEEKFLKYSLEYLVSVMRFKGMLGVSFETDSFTALLSGAFSAFIQEDSRPQRSVSKPSFKLKSDIFFNVVDKILLHLNLRTFGGIKSQKKNSENVNEILPASFNIGVGVDYIFSDLFTFFLNCENLLKNSLVKYDDWPSGMLKIIFGVTVTPDKWIEKDLQNE
ncbi:MAG: hypothetical protein LBD32_02870 [Cytophagales bacterium]|jgi:hypothetical protein|nr:hypothetical protein [Cytophagales bacterium]